jgi:hypothetical protein
LKLLDIVRQHRADTRSGNLEDLTEVELKMKIAEFVLLSEGILDDLDEQRFVAAAIAIVPHSKVEQILQSLDEIGVSISRERVMELQRDPIFLRLHPPRTCMNDTYSIEELKEYAASAVAAAAAVRSAGQASLSDIVRRLDFAVLGRRCWLSQINGLRNALFVDIALGVELLDEGPQILDFLLVLNAGKDHLGTGDFGPRVLDILGKGLFVPNDAGILVGIGITKAGDAARMAAIEAVEFRSDQVGRAGTDFVADSAFLERGGAFLDILCRRRPRPGEHEGSGGY